MRRATKRVTDTHDSVESFLGVVGEATSYDVALGLGVTQAAAQSLLTRLRSSGAIIRTGTFRKSPSTGRPLAVWALASWTPKSIPDAKKGAAPRRKIHPAITGRLVVDENGFEVSPQGDREAWKRVRGPKIGSSDLAALLGKDPYQGHWEVWDRIVLGEWSDEDSADLRRGNRQERNAIDRFEETFGLSTEPVGMISHHADDRIVSDLDAVVIRPDEWPEVIRENPLWDHVRLECTGPGALEVKVPRTAKFFEYKAEGMLLSHAIQMQHHLEVSGLPWGVLTFYNPEYDLSVAFPVVADPRLGEWIRDQIPRWYRKYVDARVRPQRPMPDPPVWPRRPPGEAKVRDDAEWRERTTLLSLRHFELVEAQQAYEQTEASLLELLSEDVEDNAVVGNGVVVLRYQTGSQKRFDSKAFLAAVKLAQQESNADALLSLDPSDEQFYYHTSPSKKVDVKVIGGNPAEDGL